RIISYGNSWIERQDNIKTILSEKNGELTKTALAQELGRTWMVRQPEEACAEAQEFAEQKSSYWKALMEVWEEYLAEPKAFQEFSSIEGLSRYMAMYQVEK